MATTVGGTSGTGQTLPNVPISNIGNLYLNGQRLSWTSTTSITVGSGQCRDQSDTVDIVMGGNLYTTSNSASGNAGQPNPVAAAAPVVVSISSVWSATQAGLDVGTIAASTEYSVYAIGDSRGFNNGSAILSLVAPGSTTTVGGVTFPLGPHLPLGYDCWRYIGSISVNASSQVRKFTQTGAQALRTIWYDPGTGPSTKGVVIPSSGTAGSTTYVNVGVFTSLIPQTALEVLLNVALTPNSANNAIFLAPATIDNGTTATVGSVASISAAATGSAQVETVRVPVALPNATQQAALTIGNVVTSLYATTSASDAVVFLLNGYVDQL